MKNKALLFAVCPAILNIIASLFCEVQANTVNLGEGHTPSISSDGRGHLFVVFEGVDGRSGAANIYYSSSNDGGKTWTDRSAVSPTLGVSTHPRVAHEKDGAVDVVWTDNPPNQSNPDIFYSRSMDSGRTWNKSVNISHTPGASQDAQLAVGADDTIHVVFSDVSDQSVSRDIFYTSSADGGKTWSSDLQVENVSNSKTDSSEPGIAVGADGIVHVAWREENSSGEQRPQIHYSQRRQSIWSPPLNISKNHSYNYHPAVACGSAGKTYINWSERSSPEGAANIWCLGSKDNSFLDHPNQVTKTGSIASASEIDADKKDRVTIAWPDRALGLGSPKIRVRVLNMDSKASRHDIKISASSKIQLSPALTIDGDKLTVVWEERGLNSTPIMVKSIHLQ